MQFEDPCPMEYQATDDIVAQPLDVGDVLEVIDVDPLLEVSNLTDDSKLLKLFANETKADNTAQQEQKFEASKPQHRNVLSMFESPKKMRRTSKSSTSTPVTVPIDEDLDRLDDMSDDSKYRRLSQSEVSIRIDDFKAITFEKLISCFYGNEDLATVEVTRLRSVSNQRTRTQDEMILFFAALRSLPNLKKLILNSFNTSDLAVICSFLRGHKTLEKIHLHLISGTVDKVVLDILSEIDSLKEVSLDVQSSFPLYLLLVSDTILRIAIPSETFSFKERHLVLTMQALAKNNTLRILDMKPKMSPSDVRLLSFGIRGNTRLRVLRFSFLANETEAGSALIHLCETIATNSSLRTVENHYARLVRVEQVDAYRMLKVLKANDSLEGLDLFDDETAEKQMNDDVPTSWENSMFSKLMCETDLPIFPFTLEPCQNFGSWGDFRRSDSRCSNSELFSSSGVVGGIPHRLRQTFWHWLDVMKQ